MVQREEHRIFGVQTNRIAKRRKAAFIKDITKHTPLGICVRVMMPAAPRLRYGSVCVVRVNIIPGSVGFVAHLSLSAPNSVPLNTIFLQQNHMSTGMYRSLKG